MYFIAVVAEPVVGATAGAVPATAGYLQRIREICDRYDVLLAPPFIISDAELDELVAKLDVSLGLAARKWRQ
ncbi:hypothetical protein [Vibrio variabilis]|uniref:hypothetical protein n=1 Tax=Vibrio variabilis TaxID=990271 RepID=UPI001EFA10A5|nr:hypothetical protein [Vibrio variabilis]